MQEPLTGTRQRTDDSVDALRRQIQATPSGRNLLLGAFVLPKLDSDPTGTVGTWPDGFVAYWVDGSSIYLGVFDRETDWVSVELIA